MGKKTISAGQVVANAQGLAHGDNQFDGYCAAYSQEAILGRSGLYDDAAQWQEVSRQKGWLNTTKQAPAGVPVFFNTSNPAKHVAISAGNGYVYSTGINGKIKKVKQSYFGNSYAGWTSGIGGRRGVSAKFIDYKDTGSKGAIISQANVSRGSSNGFKAGAVGSSPKLPGNIAAESFIPKVF
jgi:hypothetical protein